MRTHKHTHTQTYTQMYTTHVYTYAHAYAQSHTHINTHIRTQAFTYMRVNVLAHKHTRISYCTLIVAHRVIIMTSQVIDRTVVT